MSDILFATDEEIAFAEKALLPSNSSFDSERIDVIKCNETKDVVACPGSGKTTTLLAKLAIIAKRMPLPEGKGICVLTHTNVAIDEIKSKLKNQAEVLFNYPNYFGTIQSFVDKYLAIPYFNSVSDIPVSVIDDTRAISVMSKEYQSLYGKYQRLIYTKVRKQIPDSLTYKEKEKLKRELGFKKFSQLYYDDIKKVYYPKYKEKRAFVADSKVGTYELADKLRLACWDKGILRYADAYSLANSYSESCKGLRNAMSERFAYLFIDEMQDSNKMQTDLLDKLFDPTKIVIQRFGDQHQAIYSEDRQKGTWTPVKYLSISTSMRFGNNIANVLKTVCDCDNKNMKGNPNVSSLKPILMVFEDPPKVLPKYVELLKQKKIDSKSVYEVAQEIEDADLLHRNRIKAIGWVGSNKNANKLSIQSYFPQFDGQLTNKGKKSPDSLEDFLVKSHNSSVKDLKDAILEALCFVLNMFDISYSSNQGKVQYTKTRLLKFLKQNDEKRYQSLKEKMGDWILDMMAKDNSLNNRVKPSVSEYICNDLKSIFGFDKTDSKLLAFLNYSTGNHTQNTQENANVFAADGVEVDVRTVHSVKGETHIATLYLETSYHDKCEGEYLGEQLEGIAYQGKGGKYQEQALRVAYVGMSRPRYMLCMAISKEHFEKLNEDNLKNQWEIIKVD